MSDNRGHARGAMSESRPNSVLTVLDKLLKCMKNTSREEEVWLCDTASPKVCCAGRRFIGGRKIE